MRDRDKALQPHYNNEPLFTIQWCKLCFRIHLLALCQLCSSASVFINLYFEQVRVEDSQPIRIATYALAHQAALQLDVLRHSADNGCEITIV